MSSFIPLIEPTKTHHSVKLQQNPSSSFQVIGILIQKYKKKMKVRVAET